ncbi:MAG: HAMP domain-containing histidine kinase [Desulfobacula sp.]|uniref:sensor histidine kinase n=1 Tax=Desulfobacula sp. TaxID=2593537 RepID=UPI0025C349FD|nr:HAMP domain-containing sensor histidine kinase [Desulfobacula sp.]MCD4720143.1 HAMP domain-containing histidine kinase [Desulfobacula sp.]
MTSKRSIIIFWALFLVPTLIMAGIAARLLAHEQDRINRSASQALSERAKAISETIHLTVEAVQENLSRSLLDIDQYKLKKTLLIWEEINPLVRNIFIYQKDRDLEYPVRGMGSTLEERRFISRYDSLFSGRMKFDFNADPLKDELKATGLPGSYSDSSQYDSAIKKQTKSSRQKLVALSRLVQKAPASGQQAFSSDEPEQQLIEKSGWIPWFSENRLCILGWVQKYENGLVYGIELELMALLSRLVVDFPELPDNRTALILMDGNGDFMHQSGKMMVDPKEKPLAVVSISNLLPHWQMAVFIDHKGFGSNQGFLYISIILLGVFIAAIISGGILLTRLTLQNMKDARQKTSFVSSVSHELKTPLTSIRMYAELLLSKRVKDENKTQTYLSVIVNESGRLTRLINNVLDFGKLEQGKKTYHLTTFAMDQLLDQMIQAHSIRIQNQGLKIIPQIEEGDYPVKTDRDAIEQVVLNLVDNVLKYAGKGKFIKFVLEKDDSFILLKICDDGPGIPKPQREAVFEKFYRVDNSLTAQQPGSGLGLSIARQILKDLKGDLTFYPMPKNGSCFTIRIKKYEPH